MSKSYEENERSVASFDLSSLIDTDEYLEIRERKLENKPRNKTSKFSNEDNISILSYSLDSLNDKEQYLECKETKLENISCSKKTDRNAYDKIESNKSLQSMTEDKKNEQAENKIVEAKTVKRMDIRKTKSKRKDKAKTDNDEKNNPCTETGKTNLKQKKTRWYHNLNPFYYYKKVLAKDKKVQKGGESKGSQTAEVAVWLGDFYQINDKIYFSPAISQNKDIKSENDEIISPTNENMQNQGKQMKQLAPNGLRSDSSKENITTTQSNDDIITSKEKKRRNVISNNDFH
jgi:hypothetical protein